MKRALMIARKAGEQGEVPVGALLVKKDIVLASSGNLAVQKKDPTAHAELLVLQKAVTSLGVTHLHDTTLYVSLEPCLMCLGAILQLQVQRVIFGAYDPKRGASGSALEIVQLSSVDWKPDMLGGVLSERSCELLRNFFQQQRRTIPSS